jgi:molecular chaperone GrpE
MDDRSGNRDQPEAPRGPRVHDRRKIRADDGTPGSERSEAPAPETGASLSVEEQLAAAQAQAAAYLEDLQRLKAEFENYRKRILKDQTDLVDRASVALVYRLLGVLDNFELAVAAAEETRDFERMLKGVELVFGELKETLASEGLKPIDAKGKRFDPNLHEAALEVPGDPEGDLFVVEVLRTGYTIKGRVLRPAMVKVARRAGETR